MNKNVRLVTLFAILSLPVVTGCGTEVEEPEELTSSSRQAFTIDMCKSAPFDRESWVYSDKFVSVQSFGNAYAEYGPCNLFSGTCTWRTTCI